MPTSPLRDLKQDGEYSHRESNEEAVFGERDAGVDNEAGAAANASSATGRKSGNLKGSPSAPAKDDENRDTGSIHVTFGDVDEPERHRTFSHLREQLSSSSFNNNNSLYTNGSILRNISGIQNANNTGDNPPASSPLGMLYQSFANPVSDEQAIESAVRETLGNEPMWRWNPKGKATAPPVTVHDGDSVTQALAALRTGDELRSCTDPAMHYIFRNCIRAPLSERPRPYLYTEDPDSLALAAAAQAAVRHRHRGPHSPASATSESEEGLSREPVDVPAVAETAPLLGRGTAAPAAQSQRSTREEGGASVAAPASASAAPQRRWNDEPTSSSSQTLPHNASHEPAAVADGDVPLKESPSNVVTSDTPRRLSAGEEVPMDPVNKINRTYLCTGAFHAEPISEEDIGKEELIIDTFNALPSEKRRLEILEAFYVAHMQPYEQNASYTADDWDDMTETKVHRWFGVEFDTGRGCFYVTVFRRRVRIFLFSFLFRAFCLFLFWVIMFCLVPKNWFYPGGLYFDTVDTIVFAGIAGTLVARVLTIPSIVGVIWAGLLWNNVPYTGRLTKGITLDMRQFISMFGLTIGLIRAGLSLNVIRFKQKFKHYITFSLLPMSMEMVVHGVCCKFIYGYPNYRWAFAEGFLLSSIAPSVVVPVIISFQRRGYGVRDGPSMMMLCSIAVDTAVCVWGVEFLLSLEFHKMDTALLIVLAPIQVVVGLVGGVLLGALVFVATFYILFMEGERLPSVRSDRMLTLRHSVHVRYISIFFMVIVAFSGIAIGKRFSVLGGSAIGVVTIAGTFNYLCVRGGTADHLRVKADMAQTLTTVWDYIAMPSLFGLSGAAVNVHELFSRSFIGQAFGLVFIGIGTRSLFAMLSPLITRLGLSWSEILFCGLGWIGKGSVQGSLGSLAQTYATAEYAAATTPEAKEVALSRIEFGRKMKNTAVLGILVACPLCSIFLTRFTDRLLKPNT
jgi:solute carrier family 9B (sodium/hydrogen exchanger), member 1/2